MWWRIWWRIIPKAALTAMRNGHGTVPIFWEWRFELVTIAYHAIVLLGTAIPDSDTSKFGAYTSVKVLS